MKKSIVIILSIFLLTAVVALSGCTSQQATNTTASPTTAAQYPMTVTDDYGRNISIPSEPQRIISLSSENTEILFALGLGDRVVADNDYDDYPADAVNKTKVGGLTNINIEKVASLSPDVVFANTLNPKDSVQKLDTLGLKVVVNNISDARGIDNAILRVGKICNVSDNATKLVNSIDAQVKNVTDKTSALNASQKPKVLMLVDIDYLYVAGSDSYGDDLIRMAGGQNVGSNLTSYAVMSKEAILQADPDIIIVPVDQYSQAAFDGMTKGVNQSWMQGLTALKNGKVYAINADIISRQSPRVADGVQAMARDIHPELFS
ncbi:MAG TPA: ABC transporter substrate-binding protein [Methanocellaceae archaeon]|jgi:iron complex transport system substrate-binding protein